MFCLLRIEILAIFLPYAIVLRDFQYMLKALYHISMYIADTNEHCQLHFCQIQSYLISVVYPKKLYMFNSVMTCKAYGQIGFKTSLFLRRFQIIVTQVTLPSYLKALRDCSRRVCFLMWGAVSTITISTWIKCRYFWWLYRPYQRHEQVNV